MKTVAAWASGGRAGMLASLLTPEGTVRGLTEDCTAQMVEIGVAGEEPPVCAVVLLPSSELWKLSARTNKMINEGVKLARAFSPFDLVHDATKFRLLGTGEPRTKLVESAVLRVIEEHIQETRARQKDATAADELCLEAFGGANTPYALAKLRRAKWAASARGDKPMVLSNRPLTEEELPHLLPRLPKTWESVVRAAARPKNRLGNVTDPECPACI